MIGPTDRKLLEGQMPGENPPTTSPPTTPHSIIDHRPSIIGLPKIP
jgi:hypothetical protein